VYMVSDVAIPPTGFKLDLSSSSGSPPEWMQTCR
jgi:hypothetical protein